MPTLLSRVQAQNEVWLHKVEKALGARVRGVINPVDPTSVPTTSFVLPRLAMRCRPREPVAAGELLRDPAGRVLLVGDWDVSLISFVLFQMTGQVSWTRRATIIDPVTKQKSSPGAPTELGPIWVAIETPNAASDDPGLRIPVERQRCITNAPLQLGDVVNGKTVKRLMPVLGVTIAEIELLPMELAKGFQTSSLVNQSSVLRRFEVSKKLTLMLYSNIGSKQPPSLIERNSFEISGIIRSLFLICFVLRACRLAEIIKFIIRRIEVFVVYFVLRPCTCDHKPNEPMSKVQLAVNPDDQTASVIGSSSNRTYLNPITCSYVPGDYSGRRIVRQKFVCPIRCQHLTAPTRHMVTADDWSTSNG